MVMMEKSMSAFHKKSRHGPPEPGASPASPIALGDWIGDSTPANVADQEKTEAGVLFGRMVCVLQQVRNVVNDPNQILTAMVCIFFVF